MLLDDLATILSATSTTVMKGYLRELPVKTLALRETGGFPPQRTLGGGRILDEPTVQVLARSSGYQAASVLARTAYNLLDGYKDTTINGVQYHFIAALQPPFFLSRDDNHNFLCAFNVRIEREST